MTLLWMCHINHMSYEEEGKSVLITLPVIYFNIKVLIKMRLLLCFETFLRFNLVDFLSESVFFKMHENTCGS